MWSRSAERTTSMRWRVSARAASMVAFSSGSSVGRTLRLLAADVRNSRIARSSMASSRRPPRLPRMRAVSSSARTALTVSSGALSEGGIDCLSLGGVLGQLEPQFAVAVEQQCGGEDEPAVVCDRMARRAQLDSDVVEQPLDLARVPVRRFREEPRLRLVEDERLGRERPHPGQHVLLVEAGHLELDLDDLLEVDGRILAVERVLLADGLDQPVLLRRDEEDDALEPEQGRDLLEELDGVHPEAAIEVVDHDDDAGLTRLVAVRRLP